MLKQMIEWYTKRLREARPSSIVSDVQYIPEEETWLATIDGKLYHDVGENDDGGYFVCDGDVITFDFDDQFLHILEQGSAS